MTQDQFPHAFWARMIEIGKIAGAFAAIVAALTIIWAWWVPVSEFLEQQEVETAQLVALTNNVAEISTHLDAVDAKQDEQAAILARLAVDVDLATRPNIIFEVNEGQSGARTPYCIEYERCSVDVRTRRTIAGLQCKVIPDKSRFFFIEENTGARIQVVRTSGTPEQDISREWFDYNWTFDVPPDLVNPVGFVFELSYTNCRGPQDTAVLTQESPAIPVTIYGSNAVPDREATTE